MYLGCLPIVGKERGPSFEQHKFPSPKDFLCQVWLNWHGASGENDFSICQCILVFGYFPIGKGMVLHLKKKINPFHPRIFVLSLVEIDPVAVKMKM